MSRCLALPLGGVRQATATGQPPASFGGAARLPAGCWSAEGGQQDTHLLVDVNHHPAAEQQKLPPPFPPFCGIAMPQLGEGGKTVQAGGRAGRQPASSSAVLAALLALLHAAQANPWTPHKPEPQGGARNDNFNLMHSRQGVLGLAGGSGLVLPGSATPAHSRAASHSCPTCAGDCTPSLAQSATPSLIGRQARWMQMWGGML